MKGGFKLFDSNQISSERLHQEGLWPPTIDSCKVRFISIQHWKLNSCLGEALRMCNLYHCYRQRDSLCLLNICKHNYLFVYNRLQGRNYQTITPSASKHLNATNSSISIKVITVNIHEGGPRGGERLKSRVSRRDIQIPKCKSSEFTAPLFILPRRWK